MLAHARGDEPGKLIAGLKQHYRFATATLGINGYPQIVPGTILTVRKEGIVSFGEDDAAYAELCPSQFQGGGIHTPQSTICTALAPASRRYLKVSETVCVTALNVEAKTDTVSMFLATCNRNHRVTKSGAYHALVNFHFSKGSLAATSASQVEQVISQALSEGTTEVATDKEAGNGPDGKTTDAIQPIAPPPAVAQEPEPGPGTDPPAQPATSGVAKGQSTDQVVAILGPPSSIADLGAKLIYFYPNLKVVFVNGKVSQIQQI
jgi:hypothetical protein